jgi:hypothetical protein
MMSVVSSSPTIYDVVRLLAFQPESGILIPGKPRICVTRRRSDQHESSFVVSFRGDTLSSQRLMALNGPIDVSRETLCFETSEGRLILPPDWLLDFGPDQHPYVGDRRLVYLPLKEYDINLKPDGSILRVTLKRYD